MLKTDLTFEVRYGMNFHMVCTSGDMHYNSYSTKPIGFSVTSVSLISTETPIPLEYVSCPAYTKYGDYIRFLMAYLKKKHYWYFTRSSSCYMRSICLKPTIVL